MFLMSMLYVQLRHDIELLVHKKWSSYIEQVLAFLSGNLDNVLIVVCKSLSLGL